MDKKEKIQEQFCKNRDGWSQGYTILKRTKLKDIAWRLNGSQTWKFEDLILPFWVQKYRKTNNDSRFCKHAWSNNFIDWWFTNWKGHEIK